MSAKISGQVWELDLPHNEKLVLLALADHAGHDGGNVYPSLRLIAWKTDYDERQVRRIVDALEGKGVLIAVERRDGHATMYRIDLHAAPQKPPFSAVRGRPRTATSSRKTPDVLTPDNEKPLTSETKTPDISDTKPLTSETKTPDISDTLAFPYMNRPEPSLEPKETEGRNAPRSRSRKAEQVHVALAPPNIAAIRDWLGSHGHDCRHAVPFLAHYGANGWYQNGGKPVYSWTHALAGWVERQSAFEPARPPARASPPGVPPAPPGQSALVSASAEREARFNRLRAENAKPNTKVNGDKGQ